VARVALELLEGVSAVPRGEWNALVADASPFLEWDWLASLEESGAVAPETGWLARPLVARRDGRLVAACPLYLKSHSEGEFVFDWAWADAAERAGIRYYPKLLVGVPFTPVAGSRFLVAPGEDRAAWIRRLAGELRGICGESRLSGVHVNFCGEDEVRALDGDGWQLRIGVQYHWHNAGYRGFDDYLAAFRSKRRNQIRRERRAMQEAGVTIEVLAGDELPDELFEPMYHCYLATIGGHVYGRQYLNARFFELLRERFRHRLCFAVARRGGDTIAGTTNVLKGDALYGRYWGALSPLRHLHFNVCYYAAIEWCIARGVARFEPGAGGDYKYLRGFDAQPTFSLHFLSEPRLAAAVGRFLGAERAQADALIRELDAQRPLKSGPAPLPPGSGARRTPRAPR
jgi:predicted N-acyltransferase